MDSWTQRINELVNELKVSREVNSSLHRKVCSLESVVSEKQYEINSISTSILKLKSRISHLEAENAAFDKKLAIKTRTLQNELRKSSIFNQKVMATSRTKKEHLMIQEMDSLRKVNTTLTGFVDALSKNFDFDTEILKSLATIADGVDDQIIQLFIQGIRDKINLERPKTPEIVMNLNPINVNDDTKT